MQHLCIGSVSVCERAYGMSYPNLCRRFKGMIGSIKSDAPKAREILSIHGGMYFISQDGDFTLLADNADTGTKTVYKRFTTINRRDRI